MVRSKYAAAIIIFLVQCK